MIPRSFPPEGIILVGHLLAIVGAIGFALTTQYWWAGLLAAKGKPRRQDSLLVTRKRVLTPLPLAV